MSISLTLKNIPESVPLPDHFPLACHFHRYNPTALLVDRKRRSATSQRIL